MGLLGKCLLSIEKLESFSYFNIYHKLLLLKCANSFLNGALHIRNSYQQH